MSVRLEEHQRPAAVRLQMQFARRRGATVQIVMPCITADIFLSGTGGRACRRHADHGRASCSFGFVVRIRLLLNGTMHDTRIRAGDVFIS